MRSKEAPHRSAGLGTNAEVFLGSKSTSGKKTWVLGEGIGYNEVIRYKVSKIHDENHDTRIWREARGDLNVFRTLNCRRKRFLGFLFLGLNGHTKKCARARKHTRYNQEVVQKMG